MGKSKGIIRLRLKKIMTNILCHNCCENTLNKPFNELHSNNMPWREYIGVYRNHHTKTEKEWKMWYKWKKFDQYINILEVGAGILIWQRAQWWVDHCYPQGQLWSDFFWQKKKERGHCSILKKLDPHHTWMNGNGLHVFSYCRFLYHHHHHGSGLERFSYPYCLSLLLSIPPHCPIYIDTPSHQL